MQDAVSTALPFEDSTFDAIFVGQAFHWFADEPSLKEMARVLKRGGVLCLIWNLEDASVAWVKRVREAYEKHDGDVPQFRKGLWRQVWKTEVAAQLYEPPVETLHNHTYLVNEEQIWDRVISKSYIAVLPQEQQQELKRQVDSIVQEELGGRRDNIEYPQQTTVFVARKK